MAQRVTTSSARSIHLREVVATDLPIFYEHQREPEANEMAAFPARDRDGFMAHWEKILADEPVLARAIMLDGCVAGNVVSWVKDGKRLVGYWIGREHWGNGVATRGLSDYLRFVTDRPIYAHVAKHNFASVRVLKKCGFTICLDETELPGEPADGIEEVVYILSTSEGPKC